MKFGTTLRNAVYEPWREEYIDYAKLKKLLREDDSSRKDDAWTDEDAQAFYGELVNQQLEKVTNFHKSTYQKLRDRTAKCESKLDPVAKTVQDGSTDSQSKKPLPSEEERKRILKEVLQELDDITRDINELEKYSRINYTGFLKIAKKHDRKRGGRVSSIRPLVKSRMADVPFNNEDYSPLLYRLSAMYSFARQNLDGTDRPVSLVDSLPGEESYVSHKFWVHMDNLLEVKTVILRRLPVLVYNPQTSKVAEGTQQDPSITSIYFDNPDFALYSAKVEHKTDASNLRLRWYGKLSQKPEIMFEKKTVKTFEQKKDRLNSLSLYSRQNAINFEYYNAFLNELIAHKRRPVRVHCNVLTWGRSEEELTEVRKLVNAAFNAMNCKPRQNTVDIAALYWGGIPGNAGDFPSEETFYTFIAQAVCFWASETNYRSTGATKGIKLSDRLTGKPVLVDISDEPMKKQIIFNRNKFVLGPSGSGKSFFTNHMVRQYYEQGAHVLLVDTGNSYKGLCELVGGVYFTYEEDDPIAFNPFLISGKLDVEKKESSKTLLQALGK